MLRGVFQKCAVNNIVSKHCIAIEVGDRAIIAQTVGVTFLWHGTNCSSFPQVRYGAFSERPRKQLAVHI